MRSMLRRPGNAGVILVCAVAVALLAYFVASAKSTTYTAEALGVVVPSASITPDQANRLAVTYASLIPQDGAIRRRVAAAVETTPADVGRRLGAGNDSETSLLRLRYRGADADTAVAGARSALLSLTGGNPVSTNISPRSVGVVQLPRRATASKNVKSSVVVGVVLGVGLGALLVLALERGDPRVEDADELEDHLGCPVSSFESLSVVGVHALVDRWRTIAGRKAIRVALLPAGQGLDHEVRRVARTLAAAEDDAEPLTLRPGEYPENQLEPRNGSTNGNGTRKGGHRPGGGPRQKQRDRVQLRFVAGHAPGEGSGGEALAMMCDLTVLVIPRRNPAIGDRRDRRRPRELRRSPRLDDSRDPEDDVRGARRAGRRRARAADGRQRPRQAHVTSATGRNRGALEGGRAAAAMTVGVISPPARRDSFVGSVREGRLYALRPLLVFSVGACVLVGAGAGIAPRAGAAALVVVATSLAVLRRPVLGALAMVALAPPLSGLRAGLPVPGLRISETMIGGLAVLILVAAKPGRTPPWRTFDWLALAYVAATALLGAFDLHQQGATLDMDVAARLLGPLQFFLLYRALLTTLTTPGRRRTAMRLLLLASLPVSALAILQQAHVAGLPAILAGVTDSQDYANNLGVSRATGPFAIWHDLGSYLFVVILLGVSILVRETSRVIDRRLLIVVLVLAVIALIETVSFTPIAGAVIGALLLARRAGSSRRLLPRLIAFGAVAALLSMPLLASRYEEQFRSQPPSAERSILPYNFDFRLEVWNSEFRPVLARHLTTGYGPELPPNLGFAYTESVYVTLLLRGGLPLLFIYLGLMMSLALEARERKRSDDADRQAVAGALSLVIAIGFFLMLATNYFVNAGFPYLFWALAALLLAEDAGSVPRRRPSRWWRGRSLGLWRPPSGWSRGRQEGKTGVAAPEAEGGSDRSGVARVLRGFGVMSLGTLGARLIGFAVLAVVARKVGPDALGAYSFALGLAAYFVALPSNFGVGTLAIRDISREPDHARRLVGEAFTIQAVLATGCFLVFVALTPVLTHDPNVAAMMPLVGLYYVAYTLTADWALQAIDRMGSVAVVRLAGQVVFGIVTPLVLVGGFEGARRYATMMAVGAAITALAAFALVWRYAGAPHLPSSAADLRARLRRSAPIGFSLVMVQVYYSIDQILLGYLKGNHEVGQYAAAAKLPIVIAGFTALWASALYPHASRVFQRDSEAVRRQLGMFTSMSVAVALALAVSFTLVAGDLMTALFGPPSAPLRVPSRSSCGRPRSRSCRSTSPMCCSPSAGSASSPCPSPQARC